MRVYSEDFALAARATFYLATFFEGAVATKTQGPLLPPSYLLPSLCKDFDPTAALARAQGSAFARSTSNNPFPNLDI